MILSSRLENHAFVAPAHRPIHFPEELDVAGRQNGDIFRGVARGAFVADQSLVFIENLNGRSIPQTVPAVNLDRFVVAALRFSQRLRAKAVDDVKNQPAFLDRFENRRSIGAAFIHRRLGFKRHVDSQVANRLLKLGGKARGERSMLSFRIGNSTDRAADEFLVRLGNAQRHFSKSIEIVPRVQEADFHAEAL